MSAVSLPPDQVSVVDAHNQEDPLMEISSQNQIDLRNGPIVVAVNGSLESQEALRWASKRSEETGVELRVVTCYRHKHTRGQVSGVSWGGFESTKKQATADALQTVEAVLGSTDVDHVVALGPIETTLAEQAKDASMIVVGTRSAFRQTRGYRSTTDRLTGRVACPVISIPAAAMMLDEVG